MRWPLRRGILCCSGLLLLVLWVTSARAEQSWIRDLGPVNRIAGGRSLPLAVDSRGTAYLGAFSLNDGRETAWVRAFDANGTELWGVESDRGDARVTSLALDSSEHLWVVGYGPAGLEWKDAGAETSPGIRVFLSVFTSAAGLISHRSLSGNWTPQHLAARPDGGVVIVGERGPDAVTLDGHSLPSGGDTVMALFDDRARCEGVFELGHRLRVYDLRVFEDGFVRVAGSVSGGSRLGGQTLEGDPLDASGFVVRIESSGEGVVEHLSGAEGVVRRGYRTQDRVAAMVPLQGDLLLLEAESEEGPLGDERVAWSWSVPGMPSGHSRSNGMQRVAYDEAVLAHFWSPSSPAGAWIVEAGTDPTDMRPVLEIDPESDVVLRDVVVRPGELWLAGTYRTLARFAKGPDQTLENDGAHSVFLLKMKLTD